MKTRRAYAQPYISLSQLGARVAKYSWFHGMASVHGNCSEAMRRLWLLALEALCTVAKTPQWLDQATLDIRESGDNETSVTAATAAAATAAAAVWLRRR